MNVLILGFGRMGKRYLQALEVLYPTDLSVSFVDPTLTTNASKREFNSLAELSNWDFDLAIDSHPNTDRLQILETFLGRGIKKIVVEKPHARSLGESQRMIDLEYKAGAQVMLPFVFQYVDCFKAEFVKQIRAGRLASISISSGAIGFGCNGVHYLNWAHKLINDLQPGNGVEPVSVWGDLEIDKIDSPRGKNFKDHGGILVLNYPNVRVSVTIDSKSSAAPDISVLFEHGKIIYSASNGYSWQWWRRQDSENSLPMFRTHLEKPVTPPVPYEFDHIPSLGAALKDLMTGGPAPNLPDGHRTLKMIALGVKATQLKKSIGWNESADDVQFSFT